MVAKILVVDDEASPLSRLISQSFSDQIQEGKYQFFYCHDGQEAWDLLQDHQPDLMLLDLKMPRLDGFALLHRLNENHFNIKTIIISAYGTVENLKTAMREQVFEFLIKPLNRQELKEVIAKVLAIPTKRESFFLKPPSALEMTSDSKFHFNAILSLAKNLPPSQQYKLVSSLVEQFPLAQLENFEEDLPSLKLLAATEEEEREQLKLEDRIRAREGKIPLLLLQEAYIEERVQKYTKASGEESFYQYLFIRWLDPKTQRMRGRSIKKKDLEDPLFRQILERKLGKPLKM